MDDDVQVREGGEHGRRCALPPARSGAVTALTIAALYDIHGNLPALEAVFGEVLAARVDVIVVGGDVLPGPMPRQCLELLASSPVPTRWVIGNGERAVLDLLAGRTPASVPERFLPLVRWNAERLLPTNLEEIAAWHDVVELATPLLGNVLFCHATPRSDTEIFTRETPERHLVAAFDGVAADTVVCGHTHMQFDRLVGAVRVVNAGSIGAPYGQPGAYWLLIGKEIEFRRTPYDLDAAATRLCASGYPAADDFIATMRQPPPEAEMLGLFANAAIGSE